MQFGPPPAGVSLVLLLVARLSFSKNWTSEVSNFRFIYFSFEGLHFIVTLEINTNLSVHVGLLLFS